MVYTTVHCSAFTPQQEELPRSSSYMCFLYALFYMRQNRGEYYKVKWLNTSDICIPRLEKCDTWDRNFMLLLAVTTRSRRITYNKKY